MRLLLTFFLFLIAHGLLATHHEDHLARLKPRGYITELGISPSGEIWMASKAGQVYYTKEFGDLWHIGPFGSLDPSNFSSGKTFERINFLSEEVAILSGFIQENGRQNFVYRSEDGGKSWEKVVFGKSSWIDAAYFTEDGKGWMSGSSQLIYYTQDYGESWVSKDKVKKKGNLRFSTIHFSKDQKVGLFGSFWNKVYRTKDNCENWEDIETPLQQKKYTKISAKKRPDIRKIRILGDHYLINQEGRFFYSKADEIDWIRLPLIIDFEVSDDYAYFITNDLKVQLINEQLKEIWTSENTLINSPKAVKVIDSTLYAFTGDKIYRIAPKNFESSTLFTSDIPIPEPYNTLSFKGKEYGFSGLDILQFKDNRWIRIAESPFETAHSTVFQKKIIIANPSLNKRLEVNPKTGEFTPFELPKEIIPPTLSLKSITFSSGSSGCFHFDDHTRVYELKGEKLKLVKGSDDFLKKMPKELDVKLVGEILSVAHNSRLDPLTINDLELTTEDYTNFKTFITQKAEEIKQNQNGHLKFGDPYSFPGENTDFDFYKNIVDSLSNIDSELIGDAFTNGYGNWSTTTDWHQVIFKFTNGSSLLISNMDDIASYHYAPWIINFDGLTYKTNSLKLGALINDITKGDFFEAHAFESNYALFKIADYLYRKKLTSQNQ